jgi:hypothetical protein
MNLLQSENLPSQRMQCRDLPGWPAIAAMSDRLFHISACKGTARKGVRSLSTHGILLHCAEAS